MWVNAAFSGTIPSEIGMLTRANSVYARARGAAPRYHGIEIELMLRWPRRPTAPPLCASPQHSALYGNKLTGTLPTELGRLTRIVALYARVTLARVTPARIASVRGDAPLPPSASLPIPIPARTLSVGAT